MKLPGSKGERQAQKEDDERDKGGDAFKARCRLDGLVLADNP